MVKKGGVKWVLYTCYSLICRLQELNGMWKRRNCDTQRLHDSTGKVFEV